MSPDECVTGDCAVATDVNEPGALQALNYLWLRAWGYSDDEAVVEAYEDFYDVTLDVQQTESAYEALADDTTVIEDAASSLAAGAVDVAGSAAGGLAQSFVGAAGPWGTVAAVAALAGVVYVGLKAVT